MSREWIVDALRAAARRLVNARGGLLPALAAVVVVGGGSWVGVREWCLARQALTSRDPAADGDASPVALRVYELGAAPDLLVADGFAPRAGDRMGEPVPTLQRAPQGIVLEPAQGGLTTQDSRLLSGTTMHPWLAAGRASEHASLWADGPSLPALPEPVPPVHEDESVLLPPHSDPGATAHRSWEAQSIAPSIQPSPFEETETLPTAADALPPAQEPTTGGEQEPAPAEKPSATKEQRPALIDELYAREVERLLKPIGELSTKLTPPPGRFHPEIAEPDERPRLPRASELFAQEPAQLHGPGGIRTRPWPELIALWEAPGTAHHPLYFEEVNLERYGYSFGLAQPVVSAAHFFGRIPALPYLMTVDPPHRCMYTLGHYRPGSCAPLAWNLVPFDPLAAAVQGGVVTGLVYLVP